MRAKTINMEMKVAAARALADLAREDVPDEVAAAYRGARPRFGRDYIIPVPFDPRLIHVVPIAVAKAAMASGVARRPIVDLTTYKSQLSARRDPIAGAMQRIIERVRRTPKRVVFAEGEEEQVIRAAYSFVNQGLGAAILVGREERVRTAAKASGLDLSDKGIEIHNARLSQRNAIYAQFLYERLQRKGYLFRDCQRMINQDRNYFGAAMVARGDADAIVTGVTRSFSIALEEVRRVIDDKPGHRVVGVSIVLSRGRSILAADTAITEMPTAEDLAEIAIEAAGVARRLGYEPRVALLAFSNFGHPPGERTQRVQEAVRILDAKRVDFEYDGEMGADVALNKELMARRLSVLSAERHSQRAHHAGLSLRRYFHPHAAGVGRRHGDRTPDRGAGEAGADRVPWLEGFGHRQHGGDGELQYRRLKPLLEWRPRSASPWTGRAMVEISGRKAPARFCVKAFQKKCLTETAPVLTRLTNVFLVPGADADGASLNRPPELATNPRSHARPSRPGTLDRQVRKSDHRSPPKMSVCAARSSSDRKRF